MKPKFTAHADPAAQWTATRKGQAGFAYSANHLIDADHAVIVDVEATRSVRQAEVGSAQMKIDRTIERLGLYHERFIADGAYGSGLMLDWLIEERGIEQNVPVLDKSNRTNVTFSRRDFTYDHEADAYVCPGGKLLRARQKT